MDHTPGIDQNTGSLGQGVSSAVGMAMFAKMNGKSFRTYALLGDGEIEEGLVWEAAMFAGYRKLDNLCLIVDNNNLQIDSMWQTATTWSRSRLPLRKPERPKALLPSS